LEYLYHSENAEKKQIVFSISLRVIIGLFCLMEGRFDSLPITFVALRGSFRAEFRIVNFL